MSLRWSQVKLWLQWVVVSTLSLGVCLAFLGWVDGRNQNAYAFDVDYPNFFMSIASGCFLGLMQWLLLKPYIRQPLVQWLTLGKWLIGSTVGITLMAQMSRFGYVLYVLKNFNEPPSNLGDLISNIIIGAISGFVWGMVLGHIQGFTLRHVVRWRSTNAIAYGLSWSISRAIPHIDSFRWHWTLNRFPLPLKLAIEMGVLGTVVGLISSVITGFALLRFLPRDRPAS